VQLINGEPVNDDYAGRQEKALLLDWLSSAYSLSACSSAKMLVGPALRVVTKSGVQGDVIVITNLGSNASARKIAITCSGLDLAISLRCCEIILSQGAIRPVACKVTVFELKS